MSYAEFIQRKSQLDSDAGFSPLDMPSQLFDFQVALVEWAVRKGRGAIFADCGLGKTPMQLAWAHNVVAQTNRPVLIVAPLAVGPQTVREGEKFGIEVRRSSDGTINGPAIYVTNYERLHMFDSAQFSGAVCDESSAIKHFSGARQKAVTHFMAKMPYRLLCTATAAPNDYVELGNSAEALGELGFQDMASKFFKKETSKDYLGWGRTKYRMRPHAERDFWRWVCSWARAVRKPSDIGFSDDRFVLPPLIVNENLVDAKRKADGMLFDLPAMTLEDQREERRRTIPDRCERVAELIGHGTEPAVAWCHLNDEGDMIQKLIPGSEQVSGDDSDDRKEELFKAFADGQVRVLVTKPVLAGFGLNWQHCCRQTFFPSHSFEQYYQSVRRCWRFGQTKPVTVDIVASSGSAGIRANLQRKSEAADAMFEHLVSLMNDSLGIKRGSPFTKKTETPKWLAQKTSSQTNTRRTTATASK